MRKLKYLQSHLSALLWNIKLKELPRWKAGVVTALRIIHVISRDLTEGEITLRAMSLVYTSLLSFVPLLAVSFSVLKGFGVHNQIEPVLLNFLAPMGEQGIEITATVIGFVDNIKVGVLGSLGLAVLVYTVISLLQKVEKSFNYTWHIQGTRSLIRRFSDYLSVLMIGPVLVFSAIGIMVSLTASSAMQQIAAFQAISAVLEILGALLPYLLVIIAFTFVYVFIPNTRVRFKSALAGAVVAGVLWESSGWAFTTFLVSQSKYTAIYSAFASLMLFMIWLYLSWMILLLGASIAYYHQHPHSLSLQRRAFNPSIRFMEKTSVQMMVLVTRSFYQQRDVWTVSRFADVLSLPVPFVERMLVNLVKGNLLVRSADDPPCYLPAAPCEELALDQVLKVIHFSGMKEDASAGEDETGDVINKMFSHMDLILQDKLSTLTIKDLALSSMTDIAKLPNK